MTWPYCPGCPHRTVSHDPFGCRYQTCGCHVTAAQIERLGQACDHTVAPPAPDVRLSPQLAVVLGLLADGLSNVDIAAKLTIAEQTVRSHTRRLYRLLGAANRTEAVAIGFRVGYLRGDGAQ